MAESLFLTPHSAAVIGGAECIKFYDLFMSSAVVHRVHASDLNDRAMALSPLAIL